MEEMEEEEIYKEIPEYPDYKVSNIGNILSKKSGTWKPKKVHWNANHYTIRLRNEEGFKDFKVHQLIVWSFRGIKPNGYSHVTDHIDRDTRHNVLSNLRTTSQRINSQNIIKKKGKTSKYIGVSWSKQKMKWQAGFSIKISDKKRKHVHVGFFKNEKVAYMAYKRKFIKEFGYAPLNITK